MCKPHEQITGVTLLLDSAGNVAGATVVFHWFSDHESVQPVGTGPFDTPGEVLAKILGSLTTQPALF